MSSNKDMLKFLTQKLKTQSLNDVQPYQEKLDDDHDSGTESDDENQDLDEISGDGNTSPLAHNGSPIFGPMMHCLEYNATHEISEHSLDSISCTSDFERQSLDFDRHSSEEELEIIHKEVVAEKRKWSQVNRSCESAGSSDEEVKDLMLEPQPVLFRSSPPKGVHKLNNNNQNINNNNYNNNNSSVEINNRNNLNNHGNNKHIVNSSVGISNLSPPFSKNTKLLLARVAPVTVTTVSPRKRHRQTSSTSNSPTTDSADSKRVISRPSLDFEKMQKNVVKKQCTHNVGRARIVKIKTVTGTIRTPKCMSDPSLFSFRSISTSGYSPLTPVEEPSCAY